jgi:hypothetical protein
VVLTSSLFLLVRRFALRSVTCCITFCLHVLSSCLCDPVFCPNLALFLIPLQFLFYNFSPPTGILLFIISAHSTFFVHSFIYFWPEHVFKIGTRYPACSKTRASRNQFQFVLQKFPWCHHSIRACLI